MASTDILRFGHRMTGAMRLDAGTYEDVEADGRATGQALCVVFLASLAAGIGFPPRDGPWLEAVTLQTAAALLAWFVWAALVYLVGVHVFPQPATHSSVSELLRTTGFSTAPGVLLALGAIPVIGRPVLAITMVWMLATMLVAVRQALDYTSVARAAAVCAFGWLLALALLIVLGIVFTPPVY
jgi:hypothetical protein